MATYIKDLVEDNGDITRPVTEAGAVLLSGGGDLETELTKYVTAEDIADIAAIDVSALLARIYPVGSIYISATLSTPAQVSAALGGTWVTWGSGRVPVGVDTSQTEFDTVEETGGEKTHTLTIAEMPAHNHPIPATNAAVGYIETVSLGNRSAKTHTSATENRGGGQAHNNLQPYITCYMYKRTA